MLNRIRKILSFVRGDFIIVILDNERQKLIVDAGNNSKEQLKKVANTLFKSAHNIG